MTATFTSFPADTPWVAGRVSGICGDFKFEAKLFDTGSEFGINGGRVSKLQIYSKDQDGWFRCIVNYDRGWDIRPSDQNTAVFKSVMNLLEKAPKRF